MNCISDFQPGPLRNGSHSYHEYGIQWLTKKTKPIHKIYFLILISIGTSCSLFREESESLTTERVDNIAGRIKLNGYYVSVESLSNQTNRSVYFLYKNGVLMYFGTFDEGRFSEAFFTDHAILSNLKENRTTWGIYQTFDDSIRIEKWHHSGGAKKEIYIRRGVIVNDTTYMITTVERPNGIERDSINELYHFKKFHPKPDSVNDFIK